MAGMLPGVECARRRRLHQKSTSTEQHTHGSRRSSFCLYTTGYDSHLTTITTSNIMTRTVNKQLHEAALDDTARQAKERLDARLLGNKSLGSTKSSKKERNLASLDQQGMQGNTLVRVVYNGKKGTKKLMSWGKFAWKESDQVDCAICLDEFKSGEVLVHLPCAHRFHWNCAMPWVEASSMCPCCRTIVVNT